MLEVQHKWKEGDIGYFQLCRRPKSDYLDENNSGEGEEDEAYTSGSSPPDTLHGEKGYRKQIIKCLVMSCVHAYTSQFVHISYM